MRAEVEGDGPPGRVGVDGHHPGRAQGPQELHGEPAQPARADDHRGRLAVQAGQHPGDRVVGGGARVGQRPGDQRVQARQPDQAPGRRGDHIAGQAAIAAVAAARQPVRARAVLAAAAGRAGPAGRGRHQGHAFAHRERRDAGAEGGDAATHLVAQRERERPAQRLGELRGHGGHVHVRVAQPVAGHLDQHLARSRLGHGRDRELRRLAPAHDPVGGHGLPHDPPSWHEWC